MNQRKLVEAFKTFFQKSIYPNVINNQSILNQWGYFSNIINSDPIDYSQIEFYLLLANKNDNQMQNKNISSSTNSNIPTVLTNNQNNQYYRYKCNTQIIPLDRKINQQSKRKNLVTNLQMFHTMLVRNQEKLQNFNKKQISITNNGSSGRRYY